MISQEKKEKNEGPETNEVQKTFLEKVKSFFCLCTAKNNKNNSKQKKFNCCIKRSKNDEQNQVKSKTADKRDNLTDETQKTFLEKVKSSSTDERDSVTDELQKTFLEKMRLLICCCTSKKNKNNSRLKNITKKLKNEVQKKKQDKSLRIYIKQNTKWVILLLVVHIIIFGAIVSGPILVNYFRFMNQNETEQERSII